MSIGSRCRQKGRDEDLQATGGRGSRLPPRLRLSGPTAAGGSLFDPKNLRGELKDLFECADDFFASLSTEEGPEEVDTRCSFFRGGCYQDILQPFGTRDTLAHALRMASGREGD